jgi:hypothetical protein
VLQNNRGSYLQIAPNQLARRAYKYLAHQIVEKIFPERYSPNKASSSSSVRARFSQAANSCSHLRSCGVSRRPNVTARSQLRYIEFSSVRHYRPSS